jgi:hypothetical protein
MSSLLSNIEPVSMRTTELRSLINILVRRNARCADSSHTSKLNDFSLSRVRFKTCSALVDTTLKQFIIDCFATGRSEVGER